MARAKVRATTQIFKHSMILIFFFPWSFSSCFQRRASGSTEELAGSSRSHGHVPDGTHNRSTTGRRGRYSRNCSDFYGHWVGLFNLRSDVSWGPIWRNLYRFRKRRLQVLFQFVNIIFWAIFRRGRSQAEILQKIRAWFVRRLQGEPCEAYEDRNKLRQVRRCR